jgi:phage/plasmid-like protein (TIGR03299 family)
MSHMIDETRGFAAVAFAGETPWHGLGQQLTPNATIEEWTREAGLDYRVMESDVHFATPYSGDYVRFPGRKVLYRYVQGAVQSLGILGADYKVVQPATIMEFFRELTKHNGFQMETAGTLDGGKRVWALARINDGAPVLDHDVIRPYALLATSYDGTLSTTGKLTGIRVVCHNTLTASVGGTVDGARLPGAKEGGALIRIPHSRDFDIKDARIDLGIYLDQWEQFMAVQRRLARTQITEEFAVEFLKRLLPVPVVTNDAGQKVAGKVEESRPFKAIMALAAGGAIGGDSVEAKGTAFGLLNAVTQYVDHERGGDKTRLSSAWFGTGEGLKADALRKLDLVTA